MLKEPGKDYTDPTAYRPRALLNMLGKMLELIIARRISDLAERWELLPDTQYGARPGISTETALLNIYEQTRAVWVRNKKVAVMHRGSTHKYKLNQLIFCGILSSL